MSLRIRILVSIASMLIFAQSALAQERRDLKIERVGFIDGVVPGLLVEIFVAGLNERMTFIPAERFEVTVTQDGVPRQAKVHSATLGLINMQALSALRSPTAQKPDISDQFGGAQPFQMVLITVPAGLHPGDATVVISYRGRRSNEFSFKIDERLPTPRVNLGVTVPAMASRPTPPSEDDLRQRAKRGLRLERGRDSELLIRLLIDPEAADASVMVTFKQGGLSRDVDATIVRREANESRGDAIILAPVRYQVFVRPPIDLEIGPAKMEVRLRLNGRVTEPGLVDVLITDSVGDAGSADTYKPKPANLGEQRIGMGQAFQIAIDSKWLKPDPAKTLIVLEQDAKRVELKPELNSARFGASLTELAPTLLAVRLGDELTGKVSVRVYNPAKGAEAGLSEAVPLEIVEEALPPLVISVTEAERQDIAMLRALSDERLKQGRQFHEYDPDARYVTIRAVGLDYNPQFVRIKFEQGGRTLALKFADYSLNHGDRRVVRVPDAIKPGMVQITIQNKGLRGYSDPVIATVEITSRR